MRSTIIVAALLALATPAFASSAAEWDCGNGNKAISNKGFFGFDTTMGSQYGEKGWPPARGSRSLNWRWDLAKDKVWLNGKLCKRSN